MSNTIRRNKILTFSNRPYLTKKDKKNKNNNTVVQKKNMTLITKPFLSLQSCPYAQIEGFFRFENQREPPSLEKHRYLRPGTKSDILECIKTPTCRAVPAKLATVVVLDMAAVVHMVRPTKATIFIEYVTKQMMPSIPGVSDNPNSSMH